MRIGLFGGSKAGEFFLSQNADQNIVAVADNDPARHGTLLLGVPVVAPADLCHLQLDKIIITSQWVDAIRAQLTDELGINDAIITIPSKHDVKASQPFQHPATLALAHQLLLLLQRFLTRHEIRACLDSGTLLGVIRQNALIPWDDDIDLAVDAADFERLLSAIPALIPQLPKQDQINWELVIVNVDGRDCCINIEFTCPNAGFVPFDISLQMREKRGENSELVSSAGLFFAPAHHFSRFKSTTFLDETFYIPDDAEGFLTFMYGNWREPKQGTRITEYQNRRASMPVPTDPPPVTKRTLGKMR